MSTATNALQWRSAGETGEALREAAREAPGWYWVLRPHQDGPASYDPSVPVACPIHVFEDGRVSSPLADLRSLSGDQLSPRDQTGRRFPTYFAGPIVPGEPSGFVAVTLGESAPEIEGSAPPNPGWYWCRTNPEAPLLHVDAEQVGPIFVAEGPDGTPHVFSAATAHASPVDVGELGFSEPLTSSGGVIDASGELGRVRVDFLGAIALPPSIPEPAWSPRPDVTQPELELSGGETTLRVADLARGRAFYEKLGFTVEAMRAEDGWALLVGGGVRLRLVTGLGSALRFEATAQAPAALEGLGISADPSPEGLVLTDPDGHRIVIQTPSGS